MTTLAAHVEERPAGLAGLGIEARRVAIMLGLFVFFSGASIKDILPVRPIAGSIHLQDLAKAALFLGVGAYGIYRLREIKRMAAYWPGVLSWLLGGYCCLTALRADNPKFALLGSGLLALMMLFLPAALSMLGRINTLKVLLHALTIFLLATIVVFLLFPSQALFQESEGVRLGGLAHSNGVGQFAGMLLIVAMCLHDAKQLTTRQLWKYLLLTLVVFVWAQSRMPLLAAIMTLLVYLWRRGTVNAQALFRTIAVIAGLGLILMTTVFVWECIPKRPGQKHQALLTRSGDESELRTFTGRDTIWAFARQRIANHPLLGHGYGGSLLVFADAYERQELPLNFGSAHNLLLEAALNFGWLGAGILALSLLALWSLFFLRPSNFPDLTILFVSLVGITEAVLFGPVPGPATMFWILALHWRIPLPGERNYVPASERTLPRMDHNQPVGRVLPC